MRKLLIATVLAVSAHGLCIADSDPSVLPADYQRALHLIHAFSGAGSELSDAMQLAEELARSHPGQGYAEVLRAEALSTWELDQRGGPAAVRLQIIALADEALRLNPKLAQAHVARARALLRASDYEPANASINAALELDSGLAGAIFLRADMFRRTGMVERAETWYLKFIDTTPDRARKSNGYYWLAKAYQDAASRDPSQRKQLLGKAKDAFESSLELHPGGAWGNVNYAIFHNAEGVDFAVAERYAQKALSIMEFPMARHHLAIARYQQLSRGTLRASELRDAIRQIEQSTGVSLEDAVEFAGGCVGMRGRLQSVQERTRNDARLMSADGARHLDAGCRG